MTVASEAKADSPSSRLPDLIPLLDSAAEAASSLRDRCREAVAGKVSQGGKIDGDALEREQHAAHGLAWIATYAEALNQVACYAHRMADEGRFGEMEALLAQIGAAEYASQLAGGVPMSQGEIARTHELGVSEKDQTAFLTANVRDLIAATTPATRARAIALIRGSQGAVSYGDTGLDETITAMREEMHRFSEAEVVPHAQDWHLKDEYVPMELIGQMAELGVFALTLPEEYGGLGLGKEAMCVVSEELSRGYIGVGSLGTRSEIAEELILNGGTDAQKQEWLPRIASGEVLPTAVFTEPNTGSDLASLTTRAVKDGDVYRITGQKTWITHAARADLMTVLARTNPSEKGYRGLSMFLAPKPRGTDDNPFPADGMTGGEIEVLGYRGMKEFDISFDGFAVPAANLLGRRRGPGLQAADADLRGGAHPDRGARHRRGPGRARPRASLRHRAHPVRQADRELPARVGQARDDGGRDPACPPAHLFRRAREGRRPPLRSRSRHGQAARRARRLGRGRQRAADPRRQRLCAGISGEPRVVRRPHPVDLRGRRRDPGACHRPAPARRLNPNA